MLGLCMVQLRRSKSELRHWEEEARSLCPPSVYALAESSLRTKAFHSTGGSIYAMAPTVPPGLREDLTGTIVALQTISDYLDTLVDRSGCLDGATHQRLHLAFTDALDPAAAAAPWTGRYFEGFPLGDDGGYLCALVTRVLGGIARLPCYGVVRDRVLEMACLYAAMQSTKHIHPGAREASMREWHSLNCRDPVAWWEFGAASGSTLGIFALMALAAGPGATVSRARDIHHAYFPYLCGFHILLDYLIDREEDLAGGDLNFTRYYASDSEMLAALQCFVKKSEMRVEFLPDAQFHGDVLAGLPAIYLSDPKVDRLGLRPLARTLVGSLGQRSAWFYRVCRLLRRARML